jgi:cellulose synthase/poly-beta-1,6-N-acetylglucosamine synthase-like glycosyltransferase
MASSSEAQRAGGEQSFRDAGQRLLEAAPGLVTWIVLLSPVWISLIFQSAGAFGVAVCVLLFDLYWLGRSYVVITGIFQTWRRMRRDMAAPWLQRCRELGDHDPAPLDFYHLSIIPTYTEPYHVLEATVRAIAEADYPADLKMVAVITRETDKPGWENVARLKAQFGDRLRALYHVKDPLEPGIVIGKSAAMNWGGRWMVQQLTQEGYDLARVLVTDLDSDYRVHPQYFGWLSYHHALEPTRDYVIWQPVPLFHNNIWEVPTAVRVMSASTTQWQMFLHSKPRRLVAFSSYTCSLKFVKEAGYWDKDVIPEDSRFFWKAFFKFGEKFAVKPCYLPLYGDSPTSKLRGIDGYAGAHKSQYNQIKRWAWGITDVPYVLARLFKHSEIPLGLRLQRFMNLFLNHLNWIFLPIFLLFGASIPVWVSVDFSLTDFGSTFWMYSTAIMTTALSTVVLLIYLEHKMLPPKPVSWGKWRRTVIYLQYFSYPVVALVLSVLPALEAHTRLLLGKYLEYKITEKG